MDIFCSPFIDGVSTRRGSFFAALQHGLPVVTTKAYHTDEDLMADDGQAFLMTDAQDLGGFVERTVRLAGDPALRRLLGQGALRCHEKKYAPPVLAKRWLDVLGILAARSDAAGGMI